MTEPVISFEDVTITYDGAPTPVLRGVNLALPEGELCLVAGSTGSGKSTLLGAVNGLVPHFSGGRLAGRVRVTGLDTAHHPPRQLASVVGVVGQDPVAGFVTDTVEEELAYGMEQQAVPPDVMRRRVEETLDLLGIADLRRRALRSLSGGQQQRVAIGAVLTSHPSVLVLDEPTSALDPTAAEEVLAAITRLVHDLGTTVLVAEHRMERVLQYADRLVLVQGRPGRRRAAGRADDDVTGRAAGRRTGPPGRLDAAAAVGTRRPSGGRAAARAAHRGRADGAAIGRGADADVRLDARGLGVMYGATVAVRDVDLTVRAGEVVALMGRNGAGKSSLLWALQGSGPRRSGRVDVGGRDPKQVSAREARAPGRPGAADGRRPALPGVGRAGVPAGRSGVRLGRRQLRGPAGATGRRNRSGPPSERSLGGPATRARPGRPAHRGARRAAARRAHPGARLRRPRPSSPGSSAISRPRAGRSSSATHDVEFVAEVAHRVVVMAEGDVVTDGSAAHVLAGSPAFAPQVAKVLAPGPWLTVAQVALGAARRSGGRPMKPVVALRPRSALVLVVATIAGLLMFCGRSSSPSRRRPWGTRATHRCSSSSPAGARPGRAGRALRRRHGLQDPGHAGGPGGARRGPAPARGGHRRYRDGVLPARPRRPGLRRRVRIPARGCRRCSRPRCSPAESGRGCRSRWSRRPGSAWAPGCCRAGSRAGPRSRCWRRTARWRRTPTARS